MALPAVSVTLSTGGLGLTAQTGDERVMGLIFHGITTISGERVPKQFFSYADVATYIASIASVDATNKLLMLEQVADFYRLAGDNAELWVLLADSTITVSAIFDNTSTTCPARLLMEASGGRISIIGYSRQKASAAVTSGLSDEVQTGIIPAGLFAEAMATANMPIRVVLDGHAYAGDPAVLPNLRSYTSPRVAVVLSRTASAAASVLGTCVGLVLGRLAGSQVHRNLGRVASGAVSSTAYFTPTGALIRTLNKGTLGSIHDKGYIFLTWHYSKAGYYFNDDPTCTPLTNDYFSLSNGRVIDKAHRIIYAAYLEDLLDNVLVDKNTGLIVASTLKAYQGKAENAVDRGMTDQGEISGVKAFVDPKQNVLSTGKLKLKASVIPVGTNRAIEVALALVNPAIS